MERPNPTPSASQFGMTPESGRELYEQESESDAESSTSDISLPLLRPPPPVKPKARTLFIDATIAQDDTRGKSAEELKLLANMGLELAGNSIILKSDADNEAGHPIPHYLGPPRFAPIPRPQARRTLPPPVHMDGRGRPVYPHRQLGSVWMRDKVNMDSTWRHTLVRDQSNVEASSSHPGSATNGSLGDEEVVRGQLGTAASDSPSPNETPRYDVTNMETGHFYEDTADGHRQDAHEKTGTESTNPHKRGGEVTEAYCPPTNHESSDSAGMSSANNTGTSSEGPGLAEALGQIASTYLNIDVLDHSQDASRYIGYLLDTIHSLESKLHYKNARDFDGKSEKSTQSPPKEKEVPRSQVLHTVVCSVSWHDHDSLYYEDEPRYQMDDTHEYKGLGGNIEIADIGYYVEQHPEIAFVIVKEHECGPTRRQRDDDRASQRDGVRMSERKEVIHIVSAALSEALKRIAEFDPYSRDPYASGVFLGKMEAPYLFLFHHHQKLKDLVEQDNFYKPILDPLLQFLEQNYAEEYRSAHDLFQQGLVTAYHSAKLFKPFDVLLVKSHSKASRARVLGRLPGRMPKDKNRWALEGWSWTYNGLEAKRETWVHDTDPFQTEEVPITKLSVYPLRYANPEDIKKLRKTGRRYWSMRHQSLHCYTGWDEKHDRHYSNERFMVDVGTYFIMYSDRSLKAYKIESIYDKWPQRVDAAEDMPRDCELLLPNVIEGFNLGSKKWVYLHVNDFLPRVDWNKNAFKQLVLDEKIKEMIHALVDVQKSRDKAMDDIIKGKGNGLILLLHGSPGTGKTLTAESVAEIAEKPLYRVTCGDIGTDAKEVEKYLQTVLYLGKIWDCVLLLDEADVFLEERTMADLARNSLVSVFLRILEYHEGILILTSNRVGTFDEAFKSRIQVAIHYDNLSRKSRKAIWRNFFDMIDESDEDANMPELERRLDELAGEEMNGRQIRNALLTARQLAQHRNERLDWEHLNQVMKTSAAFNKYLKTVKGHTDDRWAREEGIR